VTQELEPLFYRNITKVPNNQRDVFVIQMIIKSNNKREKPIIILKSFSEQVGKNPMSFLENLIVNAEAND